MCTSAGIGSVHPPLTYPSPLDAHPYPGQYAVVRAKRPKKAADRPVFDCTTPAPTTSTYIWYLPYGVDQVCDEATGPVPIPDIARRRALEEAANGQGPQRELSDEGPTPGECYYGACRRRQEAPEVLALDRRAFTCPPSLPHSPNDNQPAHYWTRSTTRSSSSCETTPWAVRISASAARHAN